ncbi:MAG: lytic murein transglycosylase [Corynebacterium camporealensis]|uniref:lytic transglycosylase domain-containing protein n=1 Tax=Corynebacterium camporealensis TaxID=161896 RepID=UPI002A91C8A8|nr:lytic murein transglycosylase [Corynebacterium camporealensis]MDY5839569.1 lytic murein transglycosylase [Corynebacterium camporealensis]
MTQTQRSRGGCGCAGALVIVVIASLLIWSLSFLGDITARRDLGPVPDNVPPQAGQEVAHIDVHAPGRTADKLTYWSQDLSEQTRTPGQALRAYANAELIARDAWPECNLRWNTLAGLGWVETQHGTYNGNRLRPSKLNDAGYPEPAIVGIPLDGTNSTARIEDTDNGELDGDTEFDRAVGPMQFIPSSWQRYGRDANGDGRADPNQIDDAALSAAHLLCTNGGNLDEEQGWMRAIFSYNQSNQYVRDVADAANAYAVGQPA